MRLSGDRDEFHPLVLSVLYMCHKVKTRNPGRSVCRQNRTGAGSFALSKASSARGHKSRPPVWQAAPGRQAGRQSCHCEGTSSELHPNWGKEGRPQGRTEVCRPKDGERRKLCESNPVVVQSELKTSRQRTKHRVALLEKN